MSSIPMMRTLTVAALLLCTAGCITVRATVNTHDNNEILRHIVLVRFKPDTPPAEINRILREFRNLEDEISEVEHFEFGAEVSGRGLNKGFDHGGVFTFESRRDLDAYRRHPAHEGFVEGAMPFIEEIFVYDYYPERN